MPYRYPKLAEAKAEIRKLGLDEARLKSATDGTHKLTYYFPDGSKVSFGHQGNSDYLMSKDDNKRKWYRKRALTSILADGRQAAHVKYTPAWFAVNVLWP